MAKLPLLVSLLLTTRRGHREGETEAVEARCEEKTRVGEEEGAKRRKDERGRGGEERGGAR